MRFPLKTSQIGAAITGALLAAFCATGSARADVVGEMTCNIAGGEGAIVVSQRAVSCTFRSNAGPAELYNGVINRLGIDIGNQTGATLTYNVLAIGTPAPGSLAGEYIGPGFGLSLGTGGGINALVGGGNSFTLQPLSATTSAGVNFNAGVGNLQLAYVGPVAEPMARHRLVRHHARHRHH